MRSETPRFLVTAAASGSGKTLLTCGILEALRQRGLRPASFKCGPDYIDPMFHSRVIGAKSRNLDTFFTDAPTTRYLLERNSRGCDVAVVEGVMGYYDGLAGRSERGSSYDVARITDTPAIFVVNARGMGNSVIPAIKGFLDHQSDSHIRGVILNRISQAQYGWMKELIEERLDVQVVGYAPELKDCVLESRHLGLLMPDEIQGIREKLRELGKVLGETLDLDAILALGREAGGCPPEERAAMEGRLEGLRESLGGKRPRIGLARDEAFCFFYEDDLELLRDMGAELVEFSPLRDSRLPEGLDGLILNGGYPELHAKALSENRSMRESVRTAILDGLPVRAECGGFLYLHDTLEDMEGTAWEMAGVIHGRAYKTSRLGRFGYVTLAEEKDGQTMSVFGSQIGPVRAHEFHYFDSENCGEAFWAQKPLSPKGWRCMHSGETMLAGFPHLYYYSDLRLPQAFLRACIRRQEERKR